MQKIDMTTLLLSVSSAAFMGMGLTPGQDGKSEVNLPMAKQNIDLLELLHEKTKGNLTVDEAKLLEQLLFETRMRFVDAQK